MLNSYLRIHEQLREGYSRGTGGALHAGAARSVLFLGMGGSAAAGDVVTAAFDDDVPVPMAVHRGYRLPAWVGRDTVAVALSYSGNTEETLAAYDEAAKRGATVVSISGGGVLAERARTGPAHHITVPEDAPQPRAALGSLVGAAIGTLEALGVLDDAAAAVDRAASEVELLASRLGPDAPGDANSAKRVASFVGSRVPVIWGSEGVASVAAWRWKCAFNENAKIPAFASELPELNHHEVVGWTKGHADAFCLLVLREPGEHQSVQTRLEATLPEIRGADMEVLEVSSEIGSEPLSRALELMLVGDVASAYHAIERGVDPAPIEAIARVKARLAEGS